MDPLLASNGQERLQKGADVLARIVGNLLAHPADPKYRTLKITNPTFARDVWSLAGAEALLASMGFRVLGETATFPEGTPFAPLTAGLARLQALAAGQLSAVVEPTPVAAASSSSSSSSNSSSAPNAGANHPQSSTGGASSLEWEARAAILEEIRREKRKRLGDDLRANSPEVLEDTYATLSRIFTNITENPGDERYTRIRTTNAQFRRTVLDVAGGEAFVRAAGFEPHTIDGVQWLVLPPSHGAEQFRVKCEELLRLQAENRKVLDDLQEQQQQQSRDAMRRMKAAMMQQLSAPPDPGAPPTTAPATQKHLLRRLLNGGADSAQARDNEVELKALQLVEDIATLMEFHAKMSGDASYRAEWNIEKRRLYEKFKSDRDIAYLHEVMEEWEEKVQQLKRKTGRVFIDPQPSPNAPAPATEAPVGDEFDAAVEERYRRLAKH